MADDIYRCFGKLGLKKVDICGMSHGGMIAQELLIKHPEAVDKLVLCSTLCRPTEKMLETGKKWIELCEKRDIEALNDYTYRRIFSKKYHEKNAEAIKAALKVGTSEACRRFKILVEDCNAFDSYDRLRNIKCPVLVVGDKTDNVVGAEGVRDIADRLGCELYMYEGFGHDVYDEAPNFRKKIREFLLS